MNRELTREEAIRLHKEMWTDMQAELGDNPYCGERTAFKKMWVEEHFPNEHVNSNCFLCEYAQSVTKGLFTRCRECPIAWNSSSRPCCMPPDWQVCSSANVIDYRYSPISVILALPEREATE